MKKNDGSNQGNTPGNIKGMISYPCCPKQSAIVYEGAHGSASIQCSNCRKFLLLDYDRMTATITKPWGGFSGGKFFMKKILFPGLFAFKSAGGITTIVVGNHANLDNGIRARPRFSGAEEAQEEGVG